MCKGADRRVERRTDGWGGEQMYGKGGRRTERKADV